MKGSERQIGVLDRLQVVSGPLGSLFFDLEYDRAVIGRSSKCEVVLRDLSVSRRHAELRRAPSGSWQVRDMESCNGIVVDGRPARGWTLLGSGSRVTIGDIQLELVVAPSAPGEDSPTRDDLPSRQVDPGPGIEGPTKLERAGRQAAVPTDEVRRGAGFEKTAKHAPKPARGAPGGRSFAGPAGGRRARSTASSGRALPLRDGPKADQRPAPSLVMRHVLGAGIGLTLAVTLAVFAVKLAGNSSAEEEAEAPVASAPKQADTGAQRLLDRAQAKVGGESWDEAERTLKQLLQEHPNHDAASRLLNHIALERRALTEVVAAESAFDRGSKEEAQLLAEGVHARSRYRGRADELLDLIERGETSRPGPREPVLATSEPPPTPSPATPPPPTPSAKQSPRPRPQQRASAARSTTSQQRQGSTSRRTTTSQTKASNDPILVDARRAFTQGRVSESRAALEAAVDAGVAGADSLARQVEAFHRAARAGDSARDRGALPLAIASYTDALAIARELSPPSGGTPGSEAARQLADLHFRTAQDALQSNDVNTARAHLDRALGFDPNHLGARGLLQGL